MLMIFGGRVYTIKRNAEAVVVAGKETGLEVNVNKTQYMVMSGDQNGSTSHSMKIDNSSFGRMGEFRYLGTALTYQNCIQGEIKSRLKSGNACCHLVQNILCCGLLSKNLYIAYNI